MELKFSDSTLLKTINTGYRLEKLAKSTNSNYKQFPVDLDAMGLKLARNRLESESKILRCWNRNRNFTNLGIGIGIEDPGIGIEDLGIGID